MLNSSLKIFYFILILLFFYFVLSTYFSKNNTSKIASKILNIEEKSKTQSYDLPIVKNDTDNIIIYKNDLEEFKKKRKKRVWEKLLTDD